MARRRGQLRGHVHKQGNGWYLAYREDARDADGRLVRVRHNRKIADAKEVTKREAQRIAREWLGAADARAMQPYSLVTVEEFIESRFIPDVVWALKHSGKLHYDYVLKKHILPALGALPLREVTNDHVQALVRRKIDEGYAVQTALHIRNGVSAVFNHAKLKRAYTGDNPAQGVRLPEIERREAHALSFEQARALLARLSSPAREMALLAMTTSLNVAEMLGLKWSRVNLGEGPMVSGAELLPPYSLAVREQYYRGQFGSVKAKSRRRIVPLGRLLVETLTQLRQRSSFTEASDLVFATETGRPLDEANIRHRQLKPAGNALGMPWLGWHDFRRTHATFGEWIGMALSDRQAQMGHADPRMTLYYTQPDLERRRASIEAMEARLRDPEAA